MSSLALAKLILSLSFKISPSISLAALLSFLKSLCIFFSSAIEGSAA